MDKIEKRPYPSAERLFLIPFYGKYHSDVFQMGEQRLAASNRVPNNLKDSIHFVDIMEFAKILKLDQNTIDKLESLNDLVKKAQNVRNIEDIRWLYANSDWSWSYLKRIEERNLHKVNT